MTPLVTMRDAFIDRVREFAAADRAVVFVSADFGAPALDRFRRELPGQFIHSGISEQHMMDMAGGLALAGKKVYVYAMAPFISLRCIEQIKCAIGLMSLPVTIVSPGIGLGYADSGPTHYATEDFAALRAFPNLEIWTAADAATTRAIADLTHERPAGRYVRLDRDPLPDIHGDGIAGRLDEGHVAVVGDGEVCIVACGYMVHKALEARRILLAEQIDCGVVDLFMAKPIAHAIGETLARYRAIVSVEEQVGQGGLGSLVLEALNDAGIARPVRRMALPDRYFFENGGRDHLLGLAGLSPEQIAAAVRDA